MERDYEHNNICSGCMKHRLNVSSHKCEDVDNFGGYMQQTGRKRNVY